jgi:hypothetical protein
MATSPNIKTNYNRYNQNEGSWWAPYDGVELFAGKTSSGTAYKIGLRFDISAYASKTITGITSWLFRFSDGQAATKTWHMCVATALNADGTHAAVAGTDTSFSFTSANAWKSIALNTAQINALKAAPNRFLVFYGASNNTYAGIRPLEYNSGSHAPYVVVTYQDTPSLTKPVVSAVSPIKTDSHTFDWSNTSDANGVVTSGFTYIYEIWRDGDANWGASVDAGADSQATVDIVALLGIGAQDYHYKTGHKIRARAKVRYDGVDYWSSYSDPVTFTIDRRITPSAPASLAINNPTPYEGQNVIFTVGKPTTYNTKDSTGATNLFDYEIGLNDIANTVLTTALNKGEATEDIAYTMGTNLCGAEKADRVVAIRAKATDNDGQTSAYKIGNNITIKRFRRPVIIITGVERFENSAKIHVRIADTGYGAADQVNTKIQKIQFNKDGGIYYDAMLEGWTGTPALDNAFWVTGLGVNDRPLIGVKAQNYKPAGVSELSDQWSDPVAVTVVSYLPAIHAWNKKSGTGAQSGVTVQSLVVNDDLDAPVTDGSIAVKNDIEAGGNIMAQGEIYADINKSVYHEGNLPISTAGRALLDDADAAAQRATLGLGNAATKDVGTAAGQVAAGNHNHSPVYIEQICSYQADPNATNMSNILTSNENGPDGGAHFWYILTLFYSSLTGPRFQLAMPYNFTSALKYRYYFNNTWSAWASV